MRNLRKFQLLFNIFTIYISTHSTNIWVIMDNFKYIFMDFNSNKIIMIFYYILADTNYFSISVLTDSIKFTCVSIIICCLNMYC